MSDIFEDEKTSTQSAKQVFRLYRKLFLLVFGIALLWQSFIFVDMRLGEYYDSLKDSFKVILTVSPTVGEEELSRLEGSLNQQTDIQTVKLYSPQEALQIVKHQNAQLADSLLLMGKNKMPAYFEITLAPQAINNVYPFVENLMAQHKELVAHYNAAHAQLIFYTGVCGKMLRIVLVLALLVFLTFMFLVEATPLSGGEAHSMGGALSGMLAALLAFCVFAGLIFPTGLLIKAMSQFTSLGRELLLVTFCGILGWTLSKWQKF